MLFCGTGALTSTYVWWRRWESIQIPTSSVPFDMPTGRSCLGLTALPNAAHRSLAGQRSCPTRGCSIGRVNDIRVRGEVGILDGLAQQIRDLDLPDVTLQIEARAEDPGELRHSQLGELVISFTVGVASNATYAGIHALLARAHRRGEVDVADDAGTSSPDSSEPPR